MAAIRRFLLRLVSFFRADRAEADLAREIDAHLQLLEDKFVAEGMTASDARYAARRAFGGVEQVKEHQRDTRSFRWLAGWRLDLKLGVRLLIKYPGLTLVGGLAMAFAIAVGAGVFEFVTQMVRPTLPLEDGHRLVGIRLWHTASNSVEEQASHDFATWREELEAVQDLGAFRTIERNLLAPDGQGEPVHVAEITATGFGLARVPALLGRSLVESDEQPGAPSVVVIGYAVWQTRFGGDPRVVGRTVHLGSAPSTVVGVMPDGFAFPVSHDLWVPLRLNVLDCQRRQGPEIQVFGRLAPGVALDEAQAELTTIGLRAAADFPDTHEHLRPQVLPYAQSITNVSGWESLALSSINVFFVLLLVLVCANVALLMFARAATREGEIVVRTALGASRGRIITQLFVEALVLGGVAAIAGLAAAGFALRWWLGVSEVEAGGRLPFWFNDRLAPTTVLYAGALTVLGAVIAGVVPALKVTGRRVEARLRQAAAGGGGLRFGGLWTAVIVAQVAVTVAFPATAFFVRRDVIQKQTLDVGFPAAEYLSVRLEMDRESLSGASARTSRAELLAQFRSTYEELERRLAAEPGVAGVTFSDRLPRTHHPSDRIEVDGDVASRPDADLEQTASPARVDVGFFDVLGTPVLSGRGFHAGDLETRANGVVIVNQSFAKRVMGGRNPIGRRVRYHNSEKAAAEPGPWYEIVGLVGDLGMIDDASQGAGLYHPVAPGAMLPVYMAVHVEGDPESSAPRLRTIATAVDPTLRLHELLPLDEVGSTLWLEFAFLFKLLVLVSSVALLLSLAGIYSVMSFAVSRTREIGIRIALGADAWRVVAAIFRRTLAQVGLGIAAGGGLVFALTHSVTGLSPKEVGIVVAYMALMLGICLLACIVPARRALRVEPTEALRAE